jgi:hypothetical protein
LNQHLGNTGLRNIGLKDLKPRLQSKRHVLKPGRGLQGTTFAFGMIVEEAGPGLCPAGQVEKYPVTALKEAKSNLAEAGPVFGPE